MPHPLPHFMPPNVVALVVMGMIAASMDDRPVRPLDYANIRCSGSSAGRFATALGGIAFVMVLVSALIFFGTGDTSPVLGILARLFMFLLVPIVSLCGVASGVCGLACR